jgi:hypothetical protein
VRTGAPLPASTTRSGGPRMTLRRLLAAPGRHAAYLRRCRPGRPRQRKEEKRSTRSRATCLSCARFVAFVCAGGRALDFCMRALVARIAEDARLACAMCDGAGLQAGALILSIDDRTSGLRQREGTCDGRRRDGLGVKKAREGETWTADVSKH